MVGGGGMHNLCLAACFIHWHEEVAALGIHGLSKSAACRLHNHGRLHVQRRKPGVPGCVSNPCVSCNSACERQLSCNCYPVPGCACKPQMCMCRHCSPSRSCSQSFPAKAKALSSARCRSSKHRATSRCWTRWSRSCATACSSSTQRSPLPPPCRCAASIR